MATTKQTTVVQFGDDGSSSSDVVFELDGPSHLDDDGEERSQLYVDEEAVIRIHHSDDYQITDVVPLKGSVVCTGQETRTITEDVYFPLPQDGDADTDSGVKTLSYTPYGTVTATEWDGREGTGFGYSGKEVWVTGGYPCKCTLTYSVVFTMYKFTPPDLDLADDESEQIMMEAYLEAV